MIANRFTSLLSQIGETVLVNDVPMNVVVTNPTLKEDEQRYFHSLSKIEQGCIITYQDDFYLALTEVRSKRHDKFKMLGQWCNITIEMPGETVTVPRRDPVTGKIVLDKYGRPIMDTIEGEPIYIPSIVENVDLSIVGKQLVVPNNQITIKLQKNEVNQDKFKLNTEFLLVEKNWKIISVDFTESGIMKIIAESIGMPATMP